MEYFYINGKHGEKEKVKFIADLKFSNMHYKYLVYQANDNCYYVARHLNDEYLSLDTNLNDNEIKLVETALNKLIGSKL